MELVHFLFYFYHHTPPPSMHFFKFTFILLCTSDTKNTCGVFLSLWKTCYDLNTFNPVGVLANITHLVHLF